MIHLKTAQTFVILRNAKNLCAIFEKKCEILRLPTKNVGILRMTLLA